MPRRPASPADIPVLTEVIVPGQRAARGQTTREERRASDVDLDETEAEAEAEVDDGVESSMYGNLFEPAGALDIEGAIDRVVDRHAEELRQALREEFERLLEEARQRSR